MSGALFTAAPERVDTDERFTPAWIFDGLGVVFDLDVAAPIDGGDHVPARFRYTRADDGLAQPWFGQVWCNPPFSNGTPWADRFRAHGHGLWLGPVANARWWIDLVDVAGLVWHTRDLPFDHPSHAGRRSSMPLAFVALGEWAVTALTRLASSGRHRGVLLRRVEP
jgi:hypothetical protein